MGKVLLLMLLSSLKKKKSSNEKDSKKEEEFSNEVLRFWYWNWKNEESKSMSCGTKKVDTIF